MNSEEFRDRFWAHNPNYVPALGNSSIDDIWDIVYQLASDLLSIADEYFPHTFYGSDPRIQRAMLVRERFYD